ncbi:DNA-binding transcriptional regulator, MerR family [Streptomyces zhaozhouensis]|uniref:DNA-binding transcriptional regulator, MerR family n=1 Tax=Streptomyces zhaozhouensis TaxID=1300267 RepID=A0A286E1W3_9ACTN|nr:MerR family transcriptional regulator [Streptomyces zhaozhouensis]SOD64883.1 DNA-binding transcriptional regulator, MerR family [Streptomyces zhaozhouensis]
MFNIGAFAQYGGVSVRMLRHYDAVGLLRPAHVDPHTGYRSYDAAQLARLNRVIALKELGFTLAQVRAIVGEEVGASELRGMLRLRRAELESAMAADAARLAQVEARLRVIESEGRMSSDDVVIKRVPAMRVAELTAVVDSFDPRLITPVITELYEELWNRMQAAGVGASGAAVAYYDNPEGPVTVHAGIPVDVGPEPSFDFAVVELPEVEAATLVHKGPADQVIPSVQTLARWIDAHGYTSAGAAREVTLSCPHCRDHSVTELQEPIARR